MTLLNEAIRYRNERAIEILLKEPEIDINNGGKSIPPFLFACLSFLDLKIIKLFCNNPNVKIDVNMFQFCLIKGNSYASEYLINKFPVFGNDSFFMLCFHCIDFNHLISLKILIKYKLKKTTKETIIDEFNDASRTQEYQNNYYDIFMKILNEL